MPFWHKHVKIICFLVWATKDPIGNGRNWLSMCHSWQLFPFTCGFTPLNEVERAKSFICVGLVFIDIHEGLNIIFGNHNVETPMKGLKG
jgi:hypothetical protein